MKTRTADHLDAISDVAKAYGYVQIHDSGPGYDGKLVIFADAEMAHDYLHGWGVCGTSVEVGFNTRGEVDRAKARRDGEPLADVTGKRGTPGERLVWTAQIFITNPAHA